MTSTQNMRSRHDSDKHAAIAPLQVAHGGLKDGAGSVTSVPGMSGRDALYAAIEQTRMQMIVSDPNLPDNPVIFVNRAALLLTGYREDEFLGRNCRFLQGPETNPKHVAAIREALAAGRDIAIEILNYRKDGTAFWNELFISPVFDEGGRLIFHLSSQIDVSGYQTRRHSPVASEEGYRAIFDSAIDFAIIGTDADGKVVNWNEGARRILGWTLEEMRGRPASVIFTPEDCEQGRAEHEMRTALEEGRGNNERWHLRKDGSRFWASGEMMPLRRPDGSVQGFLQILRDRTEQRQEYETMRRLQRELEDVQASLEQRVEERTRALMIAEDSLRHAQKMEAVGQLTGGIAHDFNNLLTIIKSSTELLRRPDLPEDRRRRYVDAIAETVNRASKLTGQLLAFARRQSLTPEVFDVRERLGRIIDMMGSIVGPRIRIVQHLPDLPCFVEADVSQFETALVNLAVNGRDAMVDQGVLTLSVHAGVGLSQMSAPAPGANRFVAVTVGDDGCGIPQDMMARIFEPFFTTKAVGKGTGLGLSQVFGFAKQSGGTVDVASEVGRGTTFTLYLPEAEAGASALAPDTDASQSALRDAGGGGRRVLVVEDNVDVGTFSTQLLQDLGYETILATNAEAALRLLATCPDEFDVVFSDVVMPGMNGVDLGRRIGQLYPRLPVILTSGYSQVLVDEQQHGFTLLPKPYAVEDLSRVLRKAKRARVGPRPR